MKFHAPRQRSKPLTREARRTAFVMRVQFAPERITESDIERAVESTGWSREYIAGLIGQAMAGRVA